MDSGRYSTDAGDPWVFVDTAMAWWWDATGTEPGGTVGSGCIRVGLEGRRRSADRWPESDTYLFDPAAPCDTRVRDHGGTI